MATWCLALAMVTGAATLLPVCVAVSLAQSAPTGRIAGMIRNGTVGAAVPEGLEVRLITLDGNSVIDSRTASAAGGRFEFLVEPRTALTYVLRVVYRDVPYFSEAIALTPASPTADREIVIYEATAEPPALSITRSTVTAVALDRAAGELTLLREDTVLNPGDRVYVGDADGVTFRVPAFDGVLEAGGLVDDASTRYEGGVVAVATPLLPGESSIVTRYVVRYDRAADRYRLRATVPTAAVRVEARVPARFVLSFNPVDDTRRDAEITLQGERLLVLTRDDAEPGEGLLADLVGLSGVPRARNPLTEQPGAAIAALLALAAVVGGAIVIGRRAAPGGAA